MSLSEFERQLNPSMNYALYMTHACVVDALGTDTTRGFIYIVLPPLSLSLSLSLVSFLSNRLCCFDLCAA